MLANFGRCCAPAGDDGAAARSSTSRLFSPQQHPRPSFPLQQLAQEDCLVSCTLDLRMRSPRSSCRTSTVRERSGQELPTACTARAVTRVKLTLQLPLSVRRCQLEALTAHGHHDALAHPGGPGVPGGICFRAGTRRAQHARRPARQRGPQLGPQASP
jgi:hypothetical protein